MNRADRVEKALLGAGHSGVTQLDFSKRRRIGTIDGGPPIPDLEAVVRQLRRRGVDVIPYGERHGCRVFILAAFEPAYVSGWACFACGTKLGGGPPGTFAGGCPHCGGFPVGRLQVASTTRAVAA